MQITKFLTIVIVCFTNSAQAFDGRGSGNCGELRNNLLNTKQELQEAQAMHRKMKQSAQRSYRKSQQLATSLQSSYTPIEFPVDDSWVYETKDQYERALLAYNSNGCTRDGRTN